MAKTYRVVKGDTLWDIVQKPAYSKLIAGNTTQAKIKTLVKLNNIKNPDLIVVGQTLKLSGSTTTTASTTTNSPKVTAFGAVANDKSGKYRRMYAVWEWSKSGTKEYEIKWGYRTKVFDAATSKYVNVWKTGDLSTTPDKACFYDAPEDAREVRFNVRAVYTDGKTYSDWLPLPLPAYVFDDSPPKPSTPEVVINNRRMTISMHDADGDLGGTLAVFEITKTNTTSVYDKSGDIKIVNGYVSWVSSKDLQPGYLYRVRCKIIKMVDGNRLESEWSDYSNPLASAPTVPKITALQAKVRNGIYIAWDGSVVKNESLKITYEIQYVIDDKGLFDTSSSVTSESGIEGTQYNFENMTKGSKYFFRVRAIATGEGSATGTDISDWSEIREITIGKKPAAPTTWSSVATAILGEPIFLYWVHNSEDGSSETVAQLEYKVGADGKVTTIEKPNENPEETKDDTKSYTFETGAYTDGAEIYWRVRTAGITGEYGEWSEMRAFKIFCEPEFTLDVNGHKLVQDTSTDEFGELIFGFLLLKSLPIQVKTTNTTPPDVQKPIEYLLEVISGQEYDTIDFRGEMVHVNEGEAVYSQHFDTSEDLDVQLSNLELADAVTYVLQCTMIMDSGLSGVAYFSFITSFEDAVVTPTAEITLDEENFTALLSIGAVNSSNDAVKDILLSVYRREYDGTLTEIHSNLKSKPGLAVTDLHPSIDVTRYRVVAVDPESTAISCVDFTGPSFKNKPVVIQWDETWMSYEALADGSVDRVSRSGVTLTLPYNIDISHNREVEASLVKYIGRENPVAYYGTQMSEAPTLNVVIDATDEATIEALHRLSRWKGNAYVRTPVGTGYWANVRVSFGQKHNEVSIPVTLNITRVEGGA